MRIGIVNDMPLAVEALRRALALEPRHEVIWVAADGAEAVAACERNRPDLILMDLIMPVMNGAEATRRIMARSPCAILVVTSNSVQNAGRVFEAMGHGALDAVDTPELGLHPPAAAAAAPLLAKIEAIERLVQHAPLPRGPDAGRARAAPRAVKTPLVAIGASAGGPAALATILRDLPADFPAAIVIVQHVDPRFAPGMADWLGHQCLLPVRITQAGDCARPGLALLACTNKHLMLDAAGLLVYGDEPRDIPHRPSVDVFFHSVERHWPGAAIGVLLTGMGADGAAGLKALRRRGAVTIAQDQASSAVFGMPKSAAAIDAASEILSLQRIGPRLRELCPRYEENE